MSANDKKRKGESKKKHAAKYYNGNRLVFNRIRRETKNLTKNPRDIAALNRCQEIVRNYIGPLRDTLQSAIETSKATLGLEG
jgi:MinD-like ATPase involved in chromosome partitioning or flagellar assembly